MPTGRTLYPDRDTDLRGTVYLIHMDRPLAGSTAQHYIGWTALDVNDRNFRHSCGNGAAILAEAKAEGITWRVVRTWENVTRRKEFELKNWGKARQFCPECREAAGITGKTVRIRGAGGRFMGSKRG